MTPERWEKIKDLLGNALELRPEERDGYLDRSCDGDPALREEVQNLLAHESTVGSRFLNQTDLADVAAALLPETENNWSGRRLGAYQIAELIGAGGMGEVYRAFRADDQYRKQVALKLIRDGQYSGSVVARFRNERQILATLEHPNIARLLDGGTAENGLPYFVMELVEGQPIHQYCQARDLPVPERLALFLEVCSAVQYAHQRLIIHRDIKPGNILVTPDGVPKLLDFGIAKILDQQGPQPLDSTLTVFRMLTPRYASPEQVKGEPITTASDVYSLGVVLYELLTGHSPYDGSGTTFEEQSRAVCEWEPLKPSTALRPPGADRRRDVSGASEIGSVLATPDKVRRQLRGDLDNIVLMALRKEPQRRYSSVEQFAEDIRHYLRNIPVIARKDTAGYRASKFVARHKAGVGATIAIALILIAGVAVNVREARIAKRRFNDVRSLANSLIFDVHDSIKDLPGATPARKIIVDRALQYLSSIARESSGDIQLQRELATAYEKVGAVQGDYLEHNLGDSAGTLATYKTMLDLRQRIAATSKDWNDRLALAKAYRLVGHQQWAVGDPLGARDPINRAVAISEALNTAFPNNLKILYELSFDYEVSGRAGFPGDPNARQKILEAYRRELAVDEIALKVTPDEMSWLHGYSVAVGDIGNMLENIDPAEALRNYQKEMEIDQKMTQLSPDLRFRRSLAIDYGSIASVYDEVGDYSRALENNAKDLEMYKEIVQADPKNALLQQGLAITYMNTANSCARTGKINPALDYSKRALDILRPLVSAAPDKAFQQGIFAAMLVIRGTILTTANQPENAISEIEHGRSIFENLSKTGSTNIVNVAASDVKLGQAAAKAGQEQKSADYLHRALAVVEPLISGASPDLDALYVAADAYSSVGDLNSKRSSIRASAATQRKSSLLAAQAAYQSSLNAWHQIPHPNHSAPNSFPAGDPAVVGENLKKVEAALAALQ
jgi:tetratricopeptide (TPR) repeat protein/tRNA A-37 threonylcarbamoyl transferase component Bud32